MEVLGASETSVNIVTDWTRTLPPLPKDKKQNYRCEEANSITVNNEMKGMLEEVVVAHFKGYTGICLRRLQESTEKLWL
jgi:hypothetical protein